MGKSPKFSSGTTPTGYAHVSLFLTSSCFTSSSPLAPNLTSPNTISSSGLVSLLAFRLPIASPSGPARSPFLTNSPQV